MPEHLHDEIDWQATTFEGNRRRQHQEFRALSFREKLAAIEDLGEVGAFFASRDPEVRGAKRSKVDGGRAKPGDR